MKHRMKHWTRAGVAACGLMGLGVWSVAHAQSAVAHAKPQAQQRRWQDALDAFAAEDRKRPPVTGGVLFVGSSSIRLWGTLEAQFATVPVIKRGFGGSRLADCADRVQQLVVPYRPRLVVLYAGDNDLAEGRSPAQVLDSLRAFVAEVHTALPGTRIAYVSIKPSPSRAALLPKVREANALAAAYMASAPDLAFVDVFTPMLNAHGDPRPELFLPDALHLNADGYAVWQTAIAPTLR